MSNNIDWSKTAGEKLEILYLTTQLNSEQLAHELDRVYGTSNKQFTKDKIDNHLRFLVSQKKTLPTHRQVRRIGFWTHLEKSDLWRERWSLTQQQINPQQLALLVGYMENHHPSLYKRSGVYGNFLHYYNKEDTISIALTTLEKEKFMVWSQNDMATLKAFWTGNVGLDYEELAKKLSEQNQHLGKFFTPETVQKQIALTYGQDPIYWTNEMKDVFEAYHCGTYFSRQERLEETFKIMKARFPDFIWTMDSIVRGAKRMEGTLTLEGKGMPGAWKDSVPLPGLLIGMSGLDGDDPLTDIAGPASLVPESLVPEGSTTPYPSESDDAFSYETTSEESGAD